MFPQNELEMEKKMVFLYTIWELGWLSEEPVKH